MKNKREWFLFRLLPAAFLPLSLLPHYGDFFFISCLLLIAFPDFREQLQLSRSVGKLIIKWRCIFQFVLICAAVAVLYLHGDFLPRSLLIYAAAIAQCLKK